jgi:hypothetical protein
MTTLRLTAAACLSFAAFGTPLAILASYTITGDTRAFVLRMVLFFAGLAAWVCLMACVRSAQMSREQER